MSAIKNLAFVKKNNKDLVTKLTESNKERKSAEAALAGAKKQARINVSTFVRPRSNLPLLGRRLIPSRKSWRRKRKL